jgi:hypothetical protein
METLIVAAVIAISICAVILYIWELTIIGWIVDLLSAIGMPKFNSQAIPLEYEKVGEIVVVRLRDNIVTVGQCQSVQQQLRRLVEANHSNFILDFLHAGKISRNFRGVLVYLTRATRRKAEELGKPHRPLDLPRGELFPVFDDMQSAVEEMSRHDRHGWVVLVSVPVGTRAVFG